MRNKLFILFFSIWTIISYSQSCTPSATNPDSDGDGIADFCDKDDDNDGILDTDECASVNYMPLYHLYDDLQASSTNTLWLFKQEDGIGSTFVCPNPSGSNCNVSSGEFYQDTNITGSVDNLAYDDGKYYTINASGNLLYTNTVSGNFTNLGNAQIGIGYKNLGFDNGVFYHWKYNGTNLTLYSSTNPVSNGWTLVGTIVGRTTSFNLNGHSYILRDMAVNNGVFYFMYYATDSGAAQADNPFRTIVYSSSNPTSSTPGWSNLGTTRFGYLVYNIAYGSEDVLTVCDQDGDGIPNHLDLDSDADGCSDAIEGGADITNSQLVTAGGTLSGGSTSVNQNLCALTTCVSTTGINIGLPQFTTLPAGYSNTTGQTIGSSQNALVNTCICYESPTDTSSLVPVKHSITLLGRAGSDNGNWPMLRNSAYTALESKTKGFVITRNSNPESTITIPVVGMMVFDTDENAGAGCLKIYTGSGAGEGWKCFTTQTCP